MRNLTEEDLVTIAGHILAQPKIVGPHVGQRQAGKIVERLPLPTEGCPEGGVGKTVFQIKLTGYEKAVQW